MVFGIVSWIHYLTELAMGGEEQKSAGFSHPQTPTSDFIELAANLRDGRQKAGSATDQLEERYFLFILNESMEKKYFLNLISVFRKNWECSLFRLSF